MPTGHRILLSKRTSRLYESLQRSRAAQILHQQSDFAFWKVIFRPLSQLFTKFHRFQISTSWSETLGWLQIFHSLWIELRFCIHQAMISKRVGKLVLTKTIWFFHPKILLFQKNRSHSLCLNCHSTCPLAIEYYSPRGQAVSTSHFPPHGPKPWAHYRFFDSLWIALRFCIHQAMISERVGKLVLAKTNCPGQNELVIPYENYTFPNNFAK